jgi:hypothetical protein
MSVCACYAATHGPFILWSNELISKTTARSQHLIRGTGGLHEFPSVRQGGIVFGGFDQHSHMHLQALPDQLEELEAAEKKIASQLAPMDERKQAIERAAHRRVPV